ncbi:hypothetical protein A3Q56_00426 [Intoshia linei]|uniref:diacylglycerol kinase (ATP) n=1 Tax=Intoshia linei TaxID=1819745 RepID=A0A177BC30_9BILA|nr:hypothetical protein A3Q56_00426 [Intoshia linei]
MASSFLFGLKCLAFDKPTFNFLKKPITKRNNEGMLEKYPIAILPLGTGNDLSRVLNWGGGYENENLKKLMKNIKNSAEIIHLDRWSIYNFDSEKKMDINDCEDSEEFEKPGENTKIPYNIINNYFSIGVDASIAQKFHMKREKNPKKFKSRTMNKFFYFEYGTLESLINSCKNLHEHIELQCDNVDINLKDGPSLEGLTILNIPSIYGGTDIWNESKNKSKINIGDGKMEIVGITGAIHAGQIRTGLSKSGRRIAQCSKIEIRTKKTFPMQIDGEPWSQKPTLIKIHFKNSGLMYKKLNKAQIDS